jgi:tetraacyldisaccharide 4'-kinase
MKTPAFWTRPPGFLAYALTPLALAYRIVAQRRHHRTPPIPAPVPVICIGNIVAGGAGKTPTALAIAARMQATGKRVFFLTRGYGGRLKGPLQVNAAHHMAAEVGDEALLLAAAAPTIISRDRVAGAALAAAKGADLVIMDDGLQNPTLFKNLSLLVVDGPTGLGNGRYIPSGPLRETLTDALPRLHGVVIIGPDKTGFCQTLPPDLPVFRAEFQPLASTPSLQGRRLIAFAGIGRPQKFFDLCTQIGGDVVKAIPFADHAPYSAKDLARLQDLARQEKADLITTEKDAVRLPPSFRPSVLVVRGELVWENPARLDDLLLTLRDR